VRACVRISTAYSATVGVMVGGGGSILFKQINLSLMRLSAASAAIVAMGFALITCARRGADVSPRIRVEITITIHVPRARIRSARKVIVRPSQV